MTVIYKGDSLGAFGESGITVNLDYSEEFTIVRADFRIGNLPTMIFYNPEFPLHIDLDKSQTSYLESQSLCYLAVYDEQGNKVTCKGTFPIVVKDRVV